MTSLDTQCRETVESARMECGAGRSVRFTTSVSASDGRPEGRKRLQVHREPTNAAEPDVGTSTRRGVAVGHRTREGSPQGEAEDAGVTAGRDPQPIRKLLRPNCLNPGDLCAGSGPRECFACRSAAAKREAA